MPFRIDGTGTPASRQRSWSGRWSARLWRNQRAPGTPIEAQRLLKYVSCIGFADRHRRTLLQNRDKSAAGLRGSTRSLVIVGCVGTGYEVTSIDVSQRALTRGRHRQSPVRPTGGRVAPSDNVHRHVCRAARTFFDIFHLHHRYQR